MGSIDDLRPEEVILFELMKEYRVTADNLEDACEQLDEEIKRLQDARRIIAEPFEKVLADIEAKIRLPMLDRKASFICNFGKISFRKGAIRRIWNLNALDQICGAKPDIKEAIWAFRSETVGEPGVSIKLDESALKAVAGIPRGD